MTLWHIGSRTAKKIETVLQFIRDFLAAKQPHPTGGQLHAQGKPLNQAANADDSCPWTVGRAVGRNDIRRQALSSLEE